MIEAEEIAEKILDRFGLEFNSACEKNKEGKLIKLTPSGVEHTISFAIDIIIGWRSIEAKFYLGAFASKLVKGMEKAIAANLNNYKIFIKDSISSGSGIILKINNQEVDVYDYDEWPQDWSKIELNFRKGNLALDNDRSKDELINSILSYVSICVCFLPLEEQSNGNQLGNEEGQELYLLSKRYERSKINREACIKAQGIRCKVCGLLFSEVYGKIGDGFIHVHHKQPLSMMSNSYQLDPANDLVPVCPNCHSMLHRKSPPYSIEELKKMLAKDNNFV